MEELTYQDLKTDQEVTEHFDVPPQKVLDLGEAEKPEIQQHTQLPGIKVQVKDDLPNRAVILIVGQTVVHVTLEGAHKLAAALNQSANRVGNKIFEQQRLAKHAAQQKK